MNPWGLTPRESEVMSLLVTTGMEKIVAADLGISVKTVAELMRRAKGKMKAKTRLLAVLEWDRWQRKVA
jgi:FixJ family two-component response regulator